MFILAASLTVSVAPFIIRPEQQSHQRSITDVYCHPKGFKKNKIRKKLHGNEDDVIQQVQTEGTATKYHLKSLIRSINKEKNESARVTPPHL